MARVLKYVLILIAAAYAACFLCLAVLRVRYPFELEWMEGGSVEHVARILAGERLYVPPTADFVPFIYPPLYFCLSALAAKLAGIGFAPLRLVSLLSSLGSMLLVFRFVERETGGRLAGFLAACLFAATYRLSGAWMDAARVDALFLLLLLGGFYAARFYKGPAGQAFAGLLVALAFLTKQIALVMAAPVMLAAISVEGRRSAWFGGTAAALSGLSYLILDRIHHGLYRYYTVDLPRAHAIVPRYVLSFWANDLALPLAIALGLAILYLYARRLRGGRSEFLFYLCAAAGVIGGSWISKMHLGSYDNVLLPAHAVVAVLFGLGLHTAGDLAKREPLRRYPFAESFLFILGIIQFAGLAYNPFDQLPSREDRRAGSELIEKLSRIEGDILIPFHPYYATLAGKHGCMHHMAMRDVLRGSDSPLRDGLVRDIEDRLREHRYGAVVLDTRSWDFIDAVERSYGEPDALFGNESVFYPVTGTRLRPEWMWRSGGNGVGPGEIEPDGP